MTFQGLTGSKAILAIVLPFVIGLVPLIVGLIKKDKTLAIAGFIASVAAEFTLARIGIRGAGTMVALGFLIAIQRRERQQILDDYKEDKEERVLKGSALPSEQREDAPGDNRESGTPPHVDVTEDESDQPLGDVADSPETSPEAQDSLPSEPELNDKQNSTIDEHKKD